MEERVRDWRGSIEDIDTDILLSSWKKMEALLIDCGNARDPRTLVLNLLENLKDICDYDSALVLFLDGNGRVCGQHRYNIDSHWPKTYMSFYSDADISPEDQQFSIFRNTGENSSNISLHYHDWAKAEASRFVSEYIRPLGVDYSCGFALYDMNECVRTIVGLDRADGRNFSLPELKLLDSMLVHINNFHKNFYYQGFNLNSVKQATVKFAVLTKRETEITNLLCQGVSQANISHMLNISRSTTYSHIANIYEKLNVSNQQELISLVLNS